MGMVPVEAILASNRELVGEVTTRRNGILGIVKCDIHDITGYVIATCDTPGTPSISGVPR